MAYYEAWDSENLQLQSASISLCQFFPRAFSRYMALVHWSPKTGWEGWEKPHPQVTRPLCIRSRITKGQDMARKLRQIFSRDSASLPHAQESTKDWGSTEAPGLPSRQTVEAEMRLVQPFSALAQPCGFYSWETTTSRFSKQAENPHHPYLPPLILKQNMTYFRHSSFHLLSWQQWCCERTPLEHIVIIATQFLFSLMKSKHHLVNIRCLRACYATPASKQGWRF